jgi:hypothetical protein
MPITRTVNHAGNPDIIALNTIHDPVRTENNFTAGSITYLRDNSSRFREVA